MLRRAMRRDGDCSTWSCDEQSDGTAIAAHGMLRRAMSNNATRRQSQCNYCDRDKRFDAIATTSDGCVQERSPGVQRHPGVQQEGRVHVSRSDVSGNSERSPAGRNPGAQRRPGVQEVKREETQLKPWGGSGVHSARRRARRWAGCGRLVERSITRSWRVDVIRRASKLDGKMVSSGGTVVVRETAERNDQ